MDQNRRRFLKLLVIGGGVGLFAKLFGAETLSLISGDKGDSVGQQSFKGFRIEEDKGGLNVYSEKGEALFVIDNEK